MYRLLCGYEREKMPFLSVFIVRRAFIAVGVSLFLWNISLAADGGWSNWLAWTSCSVSCGQGDQRRYRACNNPPPVGGKYCVGKHMEIIKCNAPFNCTVDGDWSEWSIWTVCSVSCGEGTMHRYRECNSPTPANGGRQCEGDDRISRSCFAVKDCPRDGKWSSWSQWSMCSVTCGRGGTRHRYRSCNNPPPAADGLPCQGLTHESNPCKAVKRCPVNGQWSEWSEWTPCTVSCGSGETRRWRNCDNPPPQHEGKDCSRIEAGEMQIRSCNATKLHCPVDGGWTEWSDWGDCNSPTCSGDTSYSFRQRSCSKPLPVHGGSMCQGTFVQAGMCPSPINCAVDGGWSEWSSWTCHKCNVNRVRKCDNPVPSNGGKKCRGDHVEFYERNEVQYRDLCAEFMDADENCEGSGVVGIEGSGSNFAEEDYDDEDD